MINKFVKKKSYGDTFLKSISEHNSVMLKLQAFEQLIQNAVDACVSAIQNDGKLLICGNGGSASDAQHFAAEMVGRFNKERRAWPAIALNTDTSILTAIGNDYGYDSIFKRQLLALGNKKDVLIAISTSGNSRNILTAVECAKETGLIIIGMSGSNGGKLASMVDIPLLVPSIDTARIQEAHIFLLHHLAGSIESCLCGGKL